MKYDAIVSHPKDNVATVLRAVTAGQSLRLRRGTQIETFGPVQAIALCHKLALIHIAAGSPIIKYGEVIGESTREIAAGGHVHVHNIRSLRG